MAHSPPPIAHPDPKRPKGILKNPSFSDSPAVATPIKEPTLNPIFDVPTSLSDKDITLQNTLQNAGRRRSSSMLGRTNSSGSRRQSLASRTNSSSSVIAAQEDDDPEAPAQLKWDEANLYLNEQQKSSTMKITEPKTPYAKHYDPLEDEDELKRLDRGLEDHQDNLDEDVEEVDVQLLDPENINVDELDTVNGKAHGGSPGGEKIGTKPKGLFKDDEIPGLDIGAPEEDPSDYAAGSADRVVGDRKVVLEDGLHGEDEEDEAGKHREFMEMRKRHYEMKDVKGLLGHPEDILEEDDEDDDGDVPIRDAPTIPPVPSIPNGMA